jgi:Luciferase
MLAIISILMSRFLERIRDEILSWPDVTTEPHRFGGLEFRLDKRKMGHIHGADLPFPMNTRNEGYSLPQSGWISYWITKGENDIPSVVELFTMRYDQVKPKTSFKKKQE